MNNNTAQIVYRWLKKAGLPVSETLVTSRLLSHPGYPSVLSITDLLDELGIPNAALVVDKAKLNEIPIPFLITNNSDGNSFELINDTTKFNNSQNNSYTDWDGIVLVMENPPKFHNAENTFELKKENTYQWLRLISVALIALTILFGILSANNWFTPSLIFLNLAGCFISMLIVLKELGIENSLTQQICTAGKNTDCDAVLQSRQASIFKWLQFSDLGIVWFTAWTIILIIGNSLNTAGEILTIYSWLSLTCLPVTFLSLYYQYFKIKKWCPLCLITIALLWIQCGILLSTQNLQLFNAQLIHHINWTGLVLILTSSLWILFLRPVLEDTKFLRSEYYRLKRFKFNSTLFENALYNSKKIDVDSIHNELQLGNPKSPIQLLVACNPYCSPCARAHNILHELVENRNIGLSIRFALKISQGDQTTKTVEYLLRLLNDKPIAYKREALHRWFSLMDLAVFEKEYPLHNMADVSNQLRTYEKWAAETAIRFTPTIFINEHLLPSSYTVGDLPQLISGMINKIDTQEHHLETSLTIS